MRNENYLSQNAFENDFGLEMEKLAQDAFVRMDSQLDLSIQTLLRITAPIEFQEDDFLSSEFSEVWESLEPFQANLVNERLWFRTERQLFCERKMAVPLNRLDEVLLWCHKSNGHPGPERTVLFFLQHFFAEMNRSELLENTKKLIAPCETCMKSKPNAFADRGLVSALPIPQVSNDTLHIDFIAMDPYNNFDYVLTVVDSLTRYVQFIPCTKNITGESTMKLNMSEWIAHYGKPQEILSDNDVRFSQEKAWCRDVPVKFSTDQPTARQKGSGNAYTNPQVSVHVRAGKQW